MAHNDILEGVINDLKLDIKVAFCIEEITDMMRNFKCLWVYEENTKHIFEEKARKHWKIKDSDTFALPKNTKPHVRFADEIQGKSTGYDVIIAFGSGVINDLCKYASFRAGKSYISFPTAPSMNGYASPSVSLINEGKRVSYPAHMPYAIYIDIDVIKNAPKAMILAGIGDYLSKFTAQIDWLLSHHILGTKYDQKAYDILESIDNILLPHLCGKDCDIRNKCVIEILMIALIISGFSMYIAGSSAPMSQGEHMIAHTFEMMHSEISYKSLHGIQISVTMHNMLKIQEKILNMDYLDIDFSKSKKILKESKYAKYLMHNKYPTDIERKINDKWKDIITILQPIYDKYDNIIVEISKNIALPMSVSELGWCEDKYQNAIEIAHLIRDRVTFLDIDNNAID